MVQPSPRPRPRQAGTKAPHIRAALPKKLSRGRYVARVILAVIAGVPISLLLFVVTAKHVVMPLVDLYAETHAAETREEAGTSMPLPPNAATRFETMTSGARPGSSADEEIVSFAPHFRRGDTAAFVPLSADEEKLPAGARLALTEARRRWGEDNVRPSKAQVGLFSLDHCGARESQLNVDVRMNEGVVVERFCYPDFIATPSSIRHIGR